LTENKISSSSGALLLVADLWFLMLHCAFLSGFFYVLQHNCTFISVYIISFPLKVQVASFYVTVIKH